MSQLPLLFFVPAAVVAAAAAADAVVAHVAVVVVVSHVVGTALLVAFALEMRYVANAFVKLASPSQLVNAFWEPKLVHAFWEPKLVHAFWQPKLVQALVEQLFAALHLLHCPQIALGLLVHFLSLHFLTLESAFLKKLQSNYQIPEAKKNNKLIL